MSHARHLIRSGNGVSLFLIAFLLGFPLPPDASGQTRHDPAAVPAVGDPLTQQLFSQYVNVNGKIPTAEVRAAIELVAARGAPDQEFKNHVLAEFETSCRSDNRRTIRRNLIAVLTKWLEREGQWRWQLESETRAKEIGQAAAIQPDHGPLAFAESTMLEKLIQLGRQSDSSDIDAFVVAVRQAHHPHGKAFLLDVLNNRQAGGDPFAIEGSVAEKPSGEAVWRDAMGGSWRDAKFHAAVALAELGDPTGVEWLIAATLPNDFGIDGTVFRGQHRSVHRGSLRENCIYVLIDLAGQPQRDRNQNWTVWWAENREQFQPHPVALSLP